MPRTRGSIMMVGPPAICAVCRGPFRPSKVIGHRRKNNATGLLCPRCVNDEKAAKKRRKEGRAQ